MRRPLPFVGSRSLVLSVALVGVVGATGCQNTVTPPGLDLVEVDPNNPGNPGNPNNPNNPGDPRPTGPIDPAAARLRRLLSFQYQNAVRDLLGDDAAAVVTPPHDVPLNGLHAVGSANLSASASDIAAYEESAFAAADAAIRAPQEQQARFRVCEPTSFEDESCLGQTVAAFGRRAYRRSLSEDEQTRWTNLGLEAARAYGDFDQGLSFAFAGILQSPHFLYQVEVGVPVGGDESRRRLTGNELAARLSFFLVGSIPSDALLQAAEQGELDDNAGVEQWARTLIAEGGAREAMRHYVEERFELFTLAGLDRTNPAYTQSVRTAMKEETLRFFDDVVWERNSDARELFSLQETFVNDELAAFYNLPLPGTGAEFARVSWPEGSGRAGLLTHGGFLSRFAHQGRSSPTLRGKFIREAIMCQAVPAPPDEVITILPEESDGMPRTTRDRMQAHLTESSCRSCHLAMDPLGFPLEHFDETGRFRTHEEGLPINATSEIDGVSVVDAVGMGELMSNLDEVTSCLARGLFRHATGHIEEPGEEPSFTLVDEVFAQSGYRLQDALVAIATSDAFQLVELPE